MRLTGFGAIPARARFVFDVHAHAYIPLYHIMDILIPFVNIRVSSKEWRPLFWLFWPLMFAQSRTRAAAVLVNELDAGRFQGTPNLALLVVRVLMCFR